MSDGLLTYRGKVSSWEIDANRHWSTMFYMRDIQSASARYALTAQGLAQPKPPHVLHLRFLRELNEGETYRILSSPLPAERAPYTVLHRLRHGTTGALAAVAFEARDDAPEPDPSADDAEALAPRSLPYGAHSPEDSDARIASGAAAVTLAGVIRPFELEADGALSLLAIQTRVSDGNGPLWLHFGVPPEMFYGRGVGRVNVELKVTRHADCAAGSAVRQVSWIGALGSKTVEVCHQLEDLSSGRVLATTSTIALIIDLDRRKATDLPEDIAAALRR